MKKILLVFFALLSPAFGEIGANAPSVPSTYVAVHPRLPYPDAKFLEKICRNGNAGSSGDNCRMVSRYRKAADGWNSASPGSRIDMRYLLIAYLASKEGGKPNNTYLNKIKGFQNLTGNWSLKNGMGYWDPALALSLAYDWIYSDLDAATQASMRTSLYTMMSGFEANYEGSSPYNDQFYITGFKQMLHLMAALAIYPDDPANSLPHLRWSMDVWFNMLVPAWKQVIGGGCGASTDASNDCGGGWHEGWEYVNQADGLRAWYVTSLLAWASASGRGMAYFTQDNPWLKNWAYQSMYQARPDFNLEPIGAVSRPYFTSEYTGSMGADLGFLDGLAAIYDDATLRGWSRLVNWGGVTPDGYEPSAWPYYAPDSSEHAANGRSVLARVRNFPGWGTIFFRTGWSENDTFCTLRYGDNYWSHPVQDTGAFTCYNRGPLAIRSGSYRPGSASQHFQEYAAQAIAQNVLLIYDPHDFYSDETVPIFLNNGSTSMAPMRNDGGQRRVGSSMGNFGPMAAVEGSPSDPAQWLRNREYFHEGKLIGYAVGADNKYAMAAVDLTAAYNNLWSRNAHASAWNPREANTSNRSFRVQKAVRQFIFIPRGTAAYVIVSDQISSTNANFIKKDLIHAVNEPAISGNSYIISRTESVTAKPDASFWPQYWASSLKHCPHGCSKSSTQYQYDGKLYGWMTLPAHGPLKTVGGPGHEFEITDENGTANYNQCMRGQCATNEGFGRVPDYINPEPASAPQQPGSWRIEEMVGGNNITDQFMNVMLVTSSNDKNIVTTAPVTTLSGNNYVTTWKDKNDTCTYTLTLPQSGVGGAFTVQGSGCEAEIN